MELNSILESLIHRLVMITRLRALLTMISVWSPDSVRFAKTTSFNVRITSHGVHFFSILWWCLLIVIIFFHLHETWIIILDTESQIFFFLMFLTTTKTKKLFEARNTWHSRWWQLKLFLFIVSVAVPFLVPSDFIHLYGTLNTFVFVCRNYVMLDCKFSKEHMAVFGSCYYYRNFHPITMFKERRL